MPEAEWLMNNRRVHVCLTLLKGVILAGGHQTWCLMRVCFRVHLMAMSWHWWEGVGPLSQASQDLITSRVSLWWGQRKSTARVFRICWLSLQVSSPPSLASLLAFIIPVLGFVWGCISSSQPLRRRNPYYGSHDFLLSWSVCFIPEAFHIYCILHSPQILMSCIFLFI